MMQYDNNMDKKFRQLEAESLPDLTRLDEHWQQMQSSLQPTAIPAKRGWRKSYLTWIIAACLLAGLLVLIYQLKKPPTISSKEIKQNEIVSAPPEPVKSSITNTFPDTTKFLQQKNDDYKSATKKRRNYTKDGVTKYLIGTDSTTPSPKESAWTLESFFKQLEKPFQEFQVDNQRDTILHGADGTLLVIRAGTFNAQGKVTIVMREYYSYQDIITNKLTTTSGNDQLISGGMLHLSAYIDGKETNILPQKSIKWIVPDTSKNLGQMELFNGVVGTGSSIPTIDTATNNYMLNWVVQRRTGWGGETNVMVRVLDLRDDFVRQKTNKNRKKGVFRIDKQSKITREELIASLKEKYGYDHIRLTTRSDSWGIFHTIFRGNRRATNALGDSAWVSLSDAIMYKLNASDTNVSFPGIPIIVEEKRRQFNKDVYKLLSTRFSLDISKLGWVNCDRFYNIPGTRMDFVVNLDQAKSYYSMLVFEDIRSVIGGYASGNKWIFPNMIEGQTATLVSVGIKDGKPIAARKRITVSRQPESLQFDETNPAEFREKAGEFDVINRQ